LETVRQIYNEVVESVFVMGASNMTSTSSPRKRRFDWRLFGRDTRAGMPFILAAATVPLIAFTGLAVDAGRGYLVKSRLSHALDAAGLAGGRVALTNNWQADMETFFATNFPDGYMGSTLVSKNFQYDATTEKITATAQVNLPTTFMRVVGQAAMTVSATTEVTREIRGFELVLAMDVTGSMRGGGKITASRQAAADLIKILYGDQTFLENVWVGFVPYATAVNIGPARTDWLDGVIDTDTAYDPTIWEGCVEARLGADPTYTGLLLDQTDTRPIDGPWRAYLYPPHWNGPPPAGQSQTGGNMWTPGDASTVDETNDMSISGNEGNARTGPNLGCPQQPITPLTTDRTVIDAQIQAMLPWHRGGTKGNLDLSWAWRVLSPDWRTEWTEYLGTGLPSNYDEKLIDKVVVIMTDGRNQYYRWPGQRDYNGSYDFISDFGGYRRLDAGLLNGASSMGAARTEVDARMAATCTAMKANDIIIYALTFGGGVDTTAKNLFTACATTPAHYIHAATNSALATAFKKIGHELNNLRLSR
jgi:Flp pilus assembly protein TadG